MCKFKILLIALIFSSGSAWSEEFVKDKKKKGRIYFSWGYNKDYFSKSDIHFKDEGTDNYDFTLHGVKASDRPAFDQILKADLTIPQYSYRLGYYFNDANDLGIELNFDHTKYIMHNYQQVHLSGFIHEQFYDVDTVISPGFVLFEHTNGANFLMLNFLKKHNLHTSINKKHVLNVVGKIGAGVVIPKTAVSLFGERLDNVFHVAGYVTGMETGLRYEFGKYIFSEGTVKGTFANYTNVLTVGTGKANHTFFTAEFIISVGLQFPL
jgi:hypothetical protein